MQIGYGQRTVELGATPWSITSTLSATFVLFQLPVKTRPLTKVHDKRVHYCALEYDIQTTRSNLTLELHLV